VAHTTSPYVTAWPWSAGFGTKYADPATLPAGNAKEVAFVTSDIAVAHATSPYVTAYPWSAGFGTKYSNPATLPTGGGYGVVFGDGALAVSHVSSPYVSAYPWSAGFGAKYADPATLPAGASYQKAAFLIAAAAAGRLFVGSSLDGLSIFGSKQFNRVH
jgi:hypothetical protein